MVVSDIVETSAAAADEGFAAITPGSVILELVGLRKNYLAVEALKPATMSFKAGEVHAIVGENGAGKSTLIKLLTGVIPRSGGEIRWRGKTVALATPHEAIALGINAVHQEVVLCPHLSVAANLFLGEELFRFGLLQKSLMREKAQEVLDQLGFQIPAHVLLSQLTIGQQQLVATARAAMRGTRLLIFDEPTAYLTRQESAQLFKLIRRLKAEGVTIVYISHRMEEVFELADRVSVLRDGTHVGTRDIAGTNEAELIALMINRTIEQIYHKETIPIGETILEARGLSGHGFHNVSLSVRAGEIVGLYGLIGAGRSEMARLLYGADHRHSGTVTIDGAAVAPSDPQASIRAGMVLCPEDRKLDGIIQGRSIEENIAISSRRHFSPFGMLSLGSEGALADQFIAKLRIRTPSRKQDIINLSGGNQQKVILGRWLSEQGIKVLVIDEPTRGIDVGAKADVFRTMRRLAGEGLAILFSTSDLEEVMALSDRIAVMSNGRLITIVDRKEATEEMIVSASAEGHKTTRKHG